MEVDVSQAGVLYTTPDSTTLAVWEDGPISDQGWSVGQGPHHHPGEAAEPLLDAAEQAEVWLTVTLEPV